jgi:hypothetical protein
VQPTPFPLPSVTIDNLTTPEAIQAVIDNPNLVIRNLQITQSYHELNLAVDRYLADANVSWCAFATWASKQAGRFIRNEAVPPKLRRFHRAVGPQPNRNRRDPHVDDACRGAVQRVR